MLCLVILYQLHGERGATHIAWQKTLLTAVWTTVVAKGRGEGKKLTCAPSSAALLLTQQKQFLQVATGKYFIVCFISKVRSTFLFNWWEASIFILPWTMLDWDLQSSILHSVTKKSICFELHHNKLSFAVLSQAFYEFPFLINFRHKFNFFF